jgi:polyribonucleotide nucleotidyltransferase
MASTCGSTLALMDAGVPIKRPVSGIAMGLVERIEEDGSQKIAILSDIQGMEDFLGDMDFKVAGTAKGVTAIQMDIKVHGLSKKVLQDALKQAHDGRMHIMSEMMDEIAAPREEMSPYAPRIISMQIDPEKIRIIIGPGGKTINGIVERTGVKIDITDDGSVAVCGVDKAGIDKAIEMIQMIASDFEEGKIYVGKVVSIKEFGAFLEFAPGKEGMVHISKLDKKRINHVEDVLTLGDKVKCICLGKDKMGRISFSIKDVPTEE